MLSLTASATNYYVRTDGSNSNNGLSNSSGGAWLTISHAVGLLAAGDIVNVAPGVYNESVFYNSTAGTSGSHIQFVSTTKWGAKIAGVGGSGVAAFRSMSAYVDLVNFEVTNSGASGTQGVEMYATGCRVVGNHVHNVTGSTSGGAGIHTYPQASADIEISGNVVHDIGNYLNPSNLQVTQGIYVETLRTRVFNNIVYRVEAWGIHMFHTPYDDTITNNTVFENGWGGIIVAGTSTDYTGGTGSNDYTTVSNNIVMNNGFHGGTGRGGIIEDGQTGTHNVFYNNLVNHNQSGGATTNGVQIQLLTGVSSGNILNVDPRFVNYLADGTGDYHVTSLSVARNGGTTSGSSLGFNGPPTVDLDGVARPQESIYDIGAYEYAASFSSPIRYVQSQAQTTTSAAPALAFSANTVLSNSVFVQVGILSGTATVTSVTDSQGLVYTSAAGPVISGSETVYLFFANGAHAAADTVTVHLSASVSSDVVISEYYGSGSSFSVDQTATAVGTSSSPATANVTTTSANELLLSWVDTATTSASAAFVKTATNSSTAAGQTSLAVSITTTAGNLLVCMAREGTNSTDNFTLSDSAGNAWAQTPSGYVSASTTNRLGMFYAANAAAVTSITASYSTVGGVTTTLITCFEISGAAVSPLDGSINASLNGNTDTSITSGSLTTSQASEILIHAVGQGVNQTTWTAGAGYTIPNNNVANGSNGSNIRGAMEYQTVSSIQSGVSSGMSWSVTGGSTGSIFAAFKSARGNISPGPSYVSRQQGATYLSQDQIVAATLTGNASATYPSVPWAILLGTFTLTPTAPAPVPVNVPGPTPSPCP